MDYVKSRNFNVWVFGIDKYPKIGRRIFATSEVNKAPDDGQKYKQLKHYLYG